LSKVSSSEVISLSAVVRVSSVADWNGITSVWSILLLCDAVSVGLSVEAVSIWLFSGSSSAHWVLVSPSGGSAVLHVGSVWSITDSFSLSKAVLL